jgi:hypothetical protein
MNSCRWISRTCFRRGERSTFIIVNLFAREEPTSLPEGFIQADRLLDDDQLIDRVYEAQGERHEHSATKGRSQTPAEMVPTTAIAETRPQLELRDA